MPSNTPQLEGREEAVSPWRKPGFIAAGGFLAGVALLGVVVVATTGGTNTSTDPKAAPATTSSSAASASASQPADGSCPALTDTNTTVPSTAPAGVTWALFHGVALPASAAAGPGKTDGDVARCYARTPAGALLAATQISTRSMLAPDWRSVMTQQTYGDARQAMIDARTKAEKAGPPPTPEPGELGQLAGFKFVTYGPSTAVVEVVTRFSTGILQASALTVRWDAGRGDWQYEVSLSSAPQHSVPSLDGYVPWGGI
ncbi:hypothetical protein ACFPK5_00255 [Streptomyces beijiangensis]|uniref:hypothetical protein n=1 Tax=Streptomyces beijiangensis TaxID=163361 RepID=UPI0031D3E805